MKYEICNNRFELNINNKCLKIYLYDDIRSYFSTYYYTLFNRYGLDIEVSRCGRLDIIQYYI